jgi:hypothetical protein
VLEEATGALARLDADELSQLELRALRLQDLLANGARLMALPELQARHRVFASVVRATGDNLAILQRAGMRETRWDR